MRTLYIIPLVLMSLVSSPSWGETRLECSIVRGETGTNMMEVIITDKKVCMGDTSGSPKCARIDGTVLDYEREQSMYATVTISNTSYNFIHYVPNSKTRKPTIWKIVRLNRNTGTATVSYFDESLNTEASVIFSCRKAAQKNF